MAEIHSVIFDKVQQLAGLSRLDMVLQGPRGRPSPSAFIQILTSVSRHVDRSMLDKGEAPLSTNAALVRDLFAFLSGLPDIAPPEIHQLREFPPEPLRGWSEPRGEFFWTLAALIQDVWEHSFGGEAECDPRILAALLKLNPRRVLDFGSGAGYFAFPLARAGAEITCIEPNPLKRRFIAFRKARCAEGKQIRLSQSNQRYDLVLAINVLDHLRGPVRAIQMLASRIAEGGVLACVASFPEDGWHTGGASIRASVYREMMHHFRYPDPLDPPDMDLILLRRYEPGKKNRKKLLRLHPAAVVVRDPSNTELFTLAAPRFYVQPLVLTSHGVAFVNLFRAGRTRKEIIFAARSMGLSAAEALCAIDELENAHLIVNE